MPGNSSRHPSIARLPRAALCLGAVPSLAAILALSGCMHSPLALRTSDFAIAATAAAQNTGDAYTLVETSYRDVEVASLLAHFDDSGFDPAKLTPFINDEDRKVRVDVVETLRSYAAHLAAVSGDQPSDNLDTSAKSMATALQSVTADKLMGAHLTATDANVAATAIDAIGHELLERRRRRDLPGILKRMQQPVDTICTLLAQDIGDPEHSGLRNQLHNNYVNLIRQQKTYIGDNESKLSPSERREEIETLPKLVTAQAEGDRALAATQKSLLELAQTHTALAESANQKDAPGFRQQLRQLNSTIGRLNTFYSSLPSHH